MEIKERKYTKILVAKYSPQNGCDAFNEEILIVKPPVTEPRKEISYRFEGVKSGKKSRYGWVRIVPEFALENFVNEYLGSISEKELEYLNCMLDSISKLSDNTPVGIDYRQKSMGEFVFVLHIHKVIFHK